MVDLVALVRGDTGDSVEGMMLEEQKRKTAEEMEAERQWLEQERIRKAQLEKGREQRLRESEERISREIAQESDAFMPSVGRGLQTVGRGLQQGIAALTGDEEWKKRLLDDAREEAELFAPLEEAAPIATTAGEIVGESAPFLLPGGLLSSATTKAGIAATAGGLGALEAATIAAGKGQDVLPAAGVGGTAASALSLAIPYVGRLGGALIRKATGKAPKMPPITPDGQVSDELQDVLSKQGLTTEDLYRYTQEFPGARSDDELLRQGLFDDLDIPTTRSRITQASPDYRMERTLERADTPEGEAIRSRLVAESDAFRRYADSMAKELGDSEAAGQTIKDALIARRSGMESEAKRLYDEAARLNDGSGLPLMGDNVVDAVRGSPKALSQYEALSTTDKNRINDVLIKYGLDTNPESIQKWSQKRMNEGGLIGLDTKPKALSTATFNDMLRDLNSMMDPQNPQLNSVVGALKDGVNKEIDNLDALIADDVTGMVGQQARDSINAIRRANKYYREMSEIFDEKEIVGALTKPRRGSFTQDDILASAVYDKLKGTSRLASPESTQRLVRELRRSGEAGEKALGNLQAAIIMDFMDKSLKKSAKLGAEGGENILNWSGTNFSNAMDRFGREKLEMIFSNNPQALARMLKLESAGNLKTQAANVARSSGTADDNYNNFVRLIGEIPVLREWLRFTPSGTIVRNVADKGAKEMSSRKARKATQKMLDTSPVLKEKTEFMSLSAPNLYRMLQLGLPVGVSGATVGDMDG